MLKRISRTRLVTFWFAAVAVILVWAVGAGVSVGVSTAVLLLMMCLVPPAVMWIVVRGAPPLTVGELLHSVNNDKEGGR